LLTDDPLPPTQLKAGLPRDLATICLKCLEKSPRLRYASANELADDLQRFQAGKPIHARPVGPIAKTIRWCRRHPLAASLAGLCAILATTFLITVLIYDHKLEAALAREHELAEKERRQIVQLNISLAVTRYEAGDIFAAMLHYVEALRSDNPEASTHHRKRLAELLSECPHLIEVKELGYPVLSARPTASGILAATTANEILEFRDLLTGLAAMSAKIDTRNLRSISLCPDGRWSAHVDRDGTATIIDGKGDSAVKLTNGDGPVITEVAIHRGATTLISNHVDGSKRLWVMTDGKPVARPLPPGTSGFAVSDCGQWLLTFDADGAGQVSEINGTRAKGSLKFGTGIARVVVSANADRMITIGKDQLVRLWQVTTSEPITIPHRCDGAITHAQFSPDGSRLLLADAKGTIRVWDTSTAKPVTPTLCSKGMLAAADFQRDNHHIVMVNQSGSVRIWELPGAAAKTASRWDPKCDTQGIEDLVTLLQFLAHRRIDEQQQLTPLTAEHVRATISRENAMKRQ
jgi:hypothetical protein